MSVDVLRNFDCLGRGLGHCHDLQRVRLCVENPGCQRDDIAGGVQQVQVLQGFCQPEGLLFVVPVGRGHGDIIVPAVAARLHLRKATRFCHQRFCQLLGQRCACGPSCRTSQAGNVRTSRFANVYQCWVETDFREADLKRARHKNR